GPAAPACAAEAAGPTAPVAAGPVALGSASAAGSDDSAGSDKTAVLPVPRRERSKLAPRRRAMAPSRWGAWRAPQRAPAALAGLSLGFGLLISLGALVYLLAVIPFCCALFVGHRPQARAFPAGCFVGVCYGLLGCYLLDRPFLDSVGETVALAGVV